MPVEIVTDLQTNQLMLDVNNKYESHRLLATMTVVVILA
jgi:hypothetical protein